MEISFSARPERVKPDVDISFSALTERVRPAAQMLCGGVNDECEQPCPGCMFNGARLHRGLLQGLPRDMTVGQLADALKHIGMSA